MISKADYDLGLSVLAAWYSDSDPFDILILRYKTASKYCTIPLNNKKVFCSADLIKIVPYTVHF